MHGVMSLGQHNPPSLQRVDPGGRRRKMTPLVKLVGKGGIHSAKESKRVQRLIKERQGIKAVQPEQIGVEGHREERGVGVGFDKVVVAHGSRIDVVLAKRANKGGAHNRSVQSTPYVANTH